MQDIALPITDKGNYQVKVKIEVWNKRRIAAFDKIGKHRKGKSKNLVQEQNKGHKGCQKHRLSNVISITGRESCLKRQKTTWTGAIRSA